ncbi:MAG: hypothetical protein ABI670_08860 [Chloroflexota bacterium]
MMDSAGITDRNISSPTIYWIGGSPCSGKSSIALLIAARHDLQLYVCDDHYSDHLAAADPVSYPRLARARTATWNEVWSRPVDVATSDEFEFYREEFGMVLEDIYSMPTDRPVLAEGAALLPECVAPLVSDLHKAIWIVPTEAFQLYHYSRREWIHDILAQCENPSAAFATWMGRDAQFAETVALDARNRALRVITVDGSRSIEALAAEVEAHFGLQSVMPEKPV